MDILYKAIRGVPKREEENGRGGGGGGGGDGKHIRNKRNRDGG